jgi:hypothetical protein
LLQQFRHQPFVTGATIFRGEMDAGTSPSKLSHTKEVGLRFPAQKDIHRRPASSSATDKCLGEGGDGGHADPASDQENLPHGSWNLKGIPERTERPKKPPRLHRSQERRSAADDLIEDFHLRSAEFRVSSPEFRNSM